MSRPVPVSPWTLITSPEPVLTPEQEALAGYLALPAGYPTRIVTRWWRKVIRTDVEGDGRRLVRGPEVVS